jgi:hypothetical protein
MKTHPSRFVLVLPLIIVMLTAASARQSVAQSRGCGPLLAYEGADGDHITYVGATCAFRELMGPVSVRPHLAYGFGSYDWGDGYSGDYNGVRVGVEAYYPFSVSDSSPVVVYPLIGPGLLAWWEDCDGDGCSDTETFIDIGAGAQVKQFGFELFLILGNEDVSMDYGARVHALFNL